jgi:DNA-directed RNA polymerase specialized sigma24 family protein
MVAWEGLSIDEVAEVLDTSKTAIAMRLVRARRRLAALMRAGGFAANDDATAQQLWGMRTAAPESAE